MEEAIQIVHSVEKPVTRRGRAGKGTSKYPFSQMSVGAAFKVKFTSEANRDKEVRAVRTAVLHFENTSVDPYVQFETFTVTDKTEPNKEFPGAGIWVKRIEDHNEESLAKRNAMRERMRQARKPKEEASSANIAN